MKKQLQRSCKPMQMVIAILLGSYGICQQPAAARPLPLAQTPTESAADSYCRPPALSRVVSHQVAAGETLESIAADYGLLPVTLMGINPTVFTTAIAPGVTLRIPPFNGIEVAVSGEKTWQEIAGAYQARADVLYEVNGCPDTIPSKIFVPGVNWFPGVETAVAGRVASGDTDPLTGYPLPETAAIVSSFGWQPHPERDELTFMSGMSLQASLDTPVLVAGDGTIAFVGDDDRLGMLIVVNHAEGLQTRYAHVHNPEVELGDRVQAGQRLATVKPTSPEAGAMLYFEVRTNSVLGWVARDPGDYIPALAIR